MTNQDSGKTVAQAKTKLDKIRQKYEAMSGNPFPKAGGRAVTCFSLINAAAHMALLAIQADAAGEDAGPYIEMSNMFQTAADAQGC